MTLRLPDSGAPVAADGRRKAPSATRNLAPILDKLAHFAPKTGNALELASGTGQQIPEFAAAHPGVIWQASDRDAENLISIRAWARPLPNLLPPIVLDAAQPGWSKTHGGRDLVLMINLLHLIPAPDAAVVLAEAAKALNPGGTIIIYGPFLRGGQATSAGDAAFHASLQAQDPAIGYKDLGWVAHELAGLGRDCEVHDMPANNLLLVSRRTELAG